MSNPIQFCYDENKTFIGPWAISTLFLMCVFSEAFYCPKYLTFSLKVVSVEIQRT